MIAAITFHCLKKFRICTNNASRSSIRTDAPRPSPQIRGGGKIFVFSPPLIEGRAGGVCVSPTIKRMAAQTCLSEQAETWADATVCPTEFLRAIHHVAWRNVNKSCGDFLQSLRHYLTKSAPLFRRDSENNPLFSTRSGASGRFDVLQMTLQQTMSITDVRNASFRRRRPLSWE